MSYDITWNLVPNMCYLLSSLAPKVSTRLVRYKALHRAPPSKPLYETLPLRASLISSLAPKVSTGLARTKTIHRARSPGALYEACRLPVFL